MFVRLPNVPNVEHNLPVGCTQDQLDKVTKDPSAYGQDTVEPVQNLWASSAGLSWFQNYTAVGDLS